IDPKKMQQMMKQLGMKQEAVDAKRVVIEQDGRNIIIDNPSVSKIQMQGQETWQITGEAREEANEAETTENDIRTVMEKTGKGRKEAENALKKADGDLAQAIIELSG
ncbi:MAG TPA: nascent polypeptide-associated complex protein, partial [Candidatus Nanoarchaeia archaeon]|nr:nascent polypeptide-associated complex protein [Candidatus Nanoarchaeia archaeon]